MCILLPKKNKITLVFIKADSTGFLPLEGAVTHIVQFWYYYIIMWLQKQSAILRLLSSCGVQVSYFKHNLSKYL